MAKTKKMKVVHIPTRGYYELKKGSKGHFKLGKRLAYESGRPVKDK